jgi:predicted amino acid racemase
LLVTNGIEQVAEQRFRHAWTIVRNHDCDAARLAMALLRSPMRKPAD